MFPLPSYVERVPAGKQPYRSLLQSAYRYAQKSQDLDTWVGVIIIPEKDEERIFSGKNLGAKVYDSVGIREVNRLPNGIAPLEERLQRPAKYLWLEHAERNGVYAAARKGILLQNATIVLPWAPCLKCAKAIVGTGMRQLISHRQLIERTPDSWKEDCLEAFEMLHAYDVKLLAYDGKVGVGNLVHQFRGEMWFP